MPAIRVKAATFEFDGATGDGAIAYYPGDACVDIVGMDVYVDMEGRSGEAHPFDANWVKGYNQLVALGKPFAFTEVGPKAPVSPYTGQVHWVDGFLRGIKTDFPSTVFWMNWDTPWAISDNCEANRLMSDERVVNRADLPEFGRDTPALSQVK